jgi:dihydroorotase-like cyclic amidohydrolase
MALKVRKTNPPVRLSESGRAAIERLAAEEKTTLTAVLDKAIAAYEEKKFWEAMDAGYAAHGAELAAEYDILEGASLDGLEPV